MAYGLKSIDLPKILVLLSSVFHVGMICFVFYDPAALISSPEGGGWWDALREIKDEKARHIYPRIWGHSLLLALIVRVNWVFTVETVPALFRCVLLTYVLPMVHYTWECYIYETLPEFDVQTALLISFPWFFLAYNYRKYTKEEAKLDDTKKQD